tara:strand:- start:402 stop:602 length:201 start_codon:yes stop_codon:yes gene_type:complete
MNNRIKYLESLLPINEVILQERYFDKFEKYATHTNNGTYHWLGIRSSNTRELWLMGILFKEGVKYN